MNEVQQDLLSMYKDVKTVLDRHNIRFYVQYGTAIGALRHNGFIPWDDDIDLLVRREDLPTVDRILSEELDSDRYYYHIPSADTHPHVMRSTENMEKDLKSHTVPFIDIFPIDRYPDTGMRRKMANAMIWGHVGSIWALDRLNNARIRGMLCRIPGTFKRLADFVAGDSAMTVVYSTGFSHCIFRRECYGEPTMHVFEDSEVPLPAEIDRMLTHIFGDYMTPPPEDKRKGAGGFPCGAYFDYVRDRDTKRRTKRGR